MNKLYNDEDDIIEVRVEDALKQDFISNSLTSFWCSLLQTYPELSTKALNELILFETTLYLCEKEFLLLVSIKNKIQSTLNIEHDTRPALSQMEPQFDVCIADKRQRRS